MRTYHKLTCEHVFIDHALVHNGENGLPAQCFESVCVCASESRCEPEQLCHSRRCNTPKQRPSVLRFPQALRSDHQVPSLCFHGVECRFVEIEVTEVNLIANHDLPFGGEDSSAQGLPIIWFIHL